MAKQNKKTDIEQVVNEMPHRRAMAHFRVNMPKFLKAELNEVKAAIVDLEEMVYAAEGKVSEALLDRSKLYTIAIVNEYLPPEQAAAYKKENIDGVAAPAADANTTTTTTVNTPPADEDDEFKEPLNPGPNNSTQNNNNEPGKNTTTNNNEPPPPVGLSKEQKAEKIVAIIKDKGFITIDQLLQLGETVKEKIDYIRFSDEVRLTRDPENETHFLLQKKEGNVWVTVGIGLVVVVAAVAITWGIYKLVKMMTKK